MDSKIINDLVGIKENFELPTKLMKILLNNQEKNKLFDEFLKHENDLTHDFFRDYFQEEHSNRKDLKQDYTPDCICELISKLQPISKRILDVCSGTGALTVGSYNKQKNIIYQCEELSSRAIPILLFNLSIRGINGIVIQCDVLNNEIKAIYKLNKNGEFSDIEEVEEIEECKFDLIISNPPYSLSAELKMDERFMGYELPPKSKADYGFILDSLYRLSSNGKAFIVLPHGVLFRGSAEGKIREQLIKNNFISTIIGLPDKLFLNTQIPTLIMVLEKNKKDEDILFIDASKLCIKQGKQNDMLKEHIDKIYEIYTQRITVDKLSKLASKLEIHENDYNLNIPRYVDSFEVEPLPDLKEVIEDIIQTDNEINKCNIEIKEMLQELRGTNQEEEKYYNESIKPFIQWLGGN